MPDGFMPFAPFHDRRPWVWLGAVGGLATLVTTTAISKSTSDITSLIGAIILVAVLLIISLGLGRFTLRIWKLRAGLRKVTLPDGNEALIHATFEGPGRMIRLFARTVLLVLVVHSLYVTTISIPYYFGGTPPMEIKHLLTTVVTARPSVIDVVRLWLSSLYFSLITLSTIGYGDVSPVGTYGRLGSGALGAFVLFVTPLLIQLVLGYATTDPPSNGGTDDCDDDERAPDDATGVESEGAQPGDGNETPQDKNEGTTPLY